VFGGVPGQPPNTYFEFQVEQPVVALNNVRVAYPAELRAAGVSGQVIGQFVVDTNGVVDVATFKAIESTHELFTASVREVLPQMRFSAAEVGGRKVKQLVQQPFVFRVPGDTSAQALPVRILSPDTSALPAGVRMRRAARPGEAPPPPPDASVLPSKRPMPAANRPYFEFGVDGAAELVEGGTPDYPAALRAEGVSGQVLAQFIVNADGTVDVRSFKVIRSDHALFTAAVREALSGMRFKPAQVDGRPVRQLFQQPFVFDAAK
jgi:TonB family protein